jgi:hypothetical protein
MTCLFGRAHDLANETLRFDRASPSVANAARADAKVVVVFTHDGLDWLFTTTGVSPDAEIFEILAKATAGRFVRSCKSSTLPATTIATAVGAFILLSTVARCLLGVDNPHRCDNLRQRMTKCELEH